MRTRLRALLAAVLLLAPLPALAAPSRPDTEAHDSLADVVLARLGEVLASLFGASEDDNGPTVDPDGLVAPPAAPTASQLERKRPALRRG